MNDHDCPERPAKRIAEAQVAERLRGGLLDADVRRHDGLAGMAQLKRAKLVSVRRERGRLEAKHDASHPRVKQLDRQMLVEHRQLVDARKERDRTSGDPPERKADAFTTYGYVRDADGHALVDHEVQLRTDGCGKGEVLATTQSCGGGAYELTLEKAGRKPAKGDEGASAAAAKPVYLAVRSPAGELVHHECRPVSAQAGGLAYRDLTVPVVSKGGRDNYPARYLGNSRSRELHDVDNEKPGCQLAAIRSDHRVYFGRAELAAAAGYDTCAHCFGQEKSKR